LILRSTRVVLPDGVRPASIHVEDGRIVRVEPGAPRGAADAGAIDVGSLAVSPGIVDPHVHVNEPGRTEWEGFDTATRAAAAGGVTTIVDMPLNAVPPTTTVEGLEAKRAAARGRVHVDVAFWGGVVPGNARALDALVDAGVRGFKCFLAPSGVDEFPHVGEDDLREAMPILARRNVPLLVHAEDPTCLMTSASVASVASVTRPTRPTYQTHQTHPTHQTYQAYLATRPPHAEVAAIELMIRLSREFGVHVHVVHVACAEGANAIARAKADGVRISAETCPHYLTFAAEEIRDGATEFKCAPPIREAAHRAALRRALQSGALDFVATDHSPAPPAMKCAGDFMQAWGGIASLELSLPAVWSAVGRAFQARDGKTMSPDDAESVALRMLARWMSEAPAALAGLGAHKGRIAVGGDADLVVWDPDAEWTVDPLRMQQRHKLTPYAGRALRGVVRATYLRGERVWNEGVLARPKSGQLL